MKLGFKLFVEIVFTSLLCIKIYCANNARPKNIERHFPFTKFKNIIDLDKCRSQRVSYNRGQRFWHLIIPN